MRAEPLSRDGEPRASSVMSSTHMNAGGSSSTSSVTSSSVTTANRRFRMRCGTGRNVWVGAAYGGSHATAPTVLGRRRSEISTIMTPAWPHAA